MQLDLTPPEHEYSAGIDQAAQFLAITPQGDRPTPLMPGLRAMFGLSLAECCEAIRESRSIIGGADAKLQ